MEEEQSKECSLYLILEGVVPLENDGSMTTEEILLLHEDLPLYDPDKLPERLVRLRQSIRDANNRADEDLQAFRPYKKNHKPALFSHKGYLQWHGSDAQEQIWDDIKAESTLAVFKLKVAQEIRTQKYLDTIKERGITHKSS